MFSRSSHNNPYKNTPPPPPNGQSQHSSRGAPPGYQAVTLRVQNAPDSSYVLGNVVAVPASLFKNGQYVIVNNQFVFTARY